MDLIIVEDNELVLCQLMRLLDQSPAIRVVGTAADEDAAVMAILTNQPDAVLLDIALATGNGVRVLQRVRHAGCKSRVLVLTNHSAEVVRKNCEKFGIDGFYNKSRDVQSCFERLTLLQSELKGNPS